MALSPMSRYISSTVLTRVFVWDPAQQKYVSKPAMYREVPARSAIGYNVHVWADSDRLDRIAQQFLGDPALWWAILDINPEILDPTSIETGTLVRIPLEITAGWST